MSSLGGMEEIKGERSEQQSDKAEIHHQYKVNSSRFEVQKVIFLIKNALWLYSELCFLLQRGEQLQNNHEKNGWKVKKWSRETLDGKCDGYVRGLDGA